MTVRYVGQTLRGRIVHEASLEACVDALAFLANKELEHVVTEQINVVGDPLWYAYASQAELDADASARLAGNGPRGNWFAVITTERVK